MSVDRTINAANTTSAVAPNLVAAPHGLQRVWATLGRVVAFAIVELQKLQHDRTELVTRMVQPALWLLIFGTTFSHLQVIDTGSVSISRSWRRASSPSRRCSSPFSMAYRSFGTATPHPGEADGDPGAASALITGKAFAAGVRSVAQVVGVLGLAYLMGIALTINPLRIVAAMAVVVLGAAFFACLSMTLAGLVRNRDRLMGIGQAITMPLFFASNSLYPVDVMPAWLHTLSTVNPLSYEVDVLRALLIGTPFHAVDVVVLLVAPIIGIATASKVLRRLVA